MLYFSYGSNMSLKRLRKRVPSAQFEAVATLVEHRLRFHKKGKDGSGKCDAEFTGNPQDHVIGVIFRISPAEKEILDRKEGLGFGYEEKEVEVVTEEGKTTCAKMYYATNIDKSRKPYLWYKEHVLTGARENDLPPGYINQIESVEAEKDPDKERSKRELSIYF